VVIMIHGLLILRRHIMNRSIRLLVALLILQMAVVARADTDHTFTLDTSSWDTQPSTVALAGDFNGWSASAAPMKQDGKNWSVTVKLSDGAHAYKFVADGTRWVQDPKADPSLDVDDGNGGKNSVVKIGATDQNAADQNAADKNDAGKNDMGGNGVKFSLDTSSWAQQPASISLAGDFNAWSSTATPMKKEGNVWTVTLPLSPGVHQYKFVADGQRWLQDPKADPALDADDGNGGKNSGIKVAAGDEGAAGQTSSGVKFSLDTSSWDQQPKTVSLTGDFNSWNSTATPMTKDGNVWSVSIPLTPGVHQYKFVADGTRWLPDPKADHSLDADDGNGGKNSGIKVGDAPDKSPAGGP